MLLSRAAPHRAATGRNSSVLTHLQPRAKKTDHSNWGRPTLTRFRLPTVGNNVVRGMPRYLWRASQCWYPVQRYTSFRRALHQENDDELNKSQKKKEYTRTHNIDIISCTRDRKVFTVVGET
jgi:hypothetical protein